MADSDTEQIESVDAVIGFVPSPRDGQTIESTISRIVESAFPLKTALVHPPSTSNRTEPPKLGPQWRLVANPQLAQDPSSLAQSLGDSFHAVFDIAQKLGARACAVVASDLSGTTVDWVSALLQPVVEEQFDLVAPCYARHPFEGMINRAIVYPLVRALYGKQIRNPMGPDFGISSRLLQRIAGSPRARPLPDPRTGTAPRCTLGSCMTRASRRPVRPRACSPSAPTASLARIQPRLRSMSTKRPCMPPTRWSSRRQPICRRSPPAAARSFSSMETVIPGFRRWIRSSIIGPLPLRTAVQIGRASGRERVPP